MLSAEVTPRDLCCALAAFVLVASLGLADGGFHATAWGWAAVALLLPVTGILASWPVPALGRLEVVFLAALAALLAWTLLSAAWSLDADQSVLEGERTLVYLAAVSLAMLVFRPPAAALLLAAVLAAIVLVAASALFVHLLSGERTASEFVAAVPYAESKLAGRLGYSNALGLFAAVGLLIAAGFAARSMSGSARAACGAAFVVLATTLYLTFGRGAWAALAAGLVATLAVDRRRLENSALLLALALPATVALLVAARSDSLTRHGAASDELVREGTLLALGLLGLSALGAVVGYLAPRMVALLEQRTRARRVYAVAVIAATAALIAAGMIAVGGPIALARQAYASFGTPSPTNQTDLNQRLLSLSGSGRSEYWRVAWKTYREHPVLGAGAGSFGREWLLERRNDLPVQDAHSLYLETVAELGPLGLVLLLALLGAPLAAGFRARAHPLAPVALGAYVAYLAHAGLDWDWELPAVTVAGLGCGVSLLLLAREDAEPRSGRWRAAAAAVSAILAVAAAIGFVGNRAASASADAYDAGRWREAGEQARAATRWTPWSAEPWRLLGEAQLARGEVTAARRSILTGLERDPSDWELWLDLALASDGEASRRALARASGLNPRSPEILELRASG